MAVYTHLPAEALAGLIAEYDVGALVSAKGIAEGVSNSNWVVETSGGDGTGARFILTMYERRIDLEDLPFFLDLLDHLSAAGAPVPRTIHDRSGKSFRSIHGKAVALIEFLPGVSIDHPTPGQAHAVGAALAQMHRAALDFPQSRANALDLVTNLSTLAACGEAALAAIDPALAGCIARSEAIAAAWPEDLPQSVIHSDLFPDNVLMLGDRVSGMIDFYFACTDAMAYDLAVTHAAWSFERGGSKYRPDIGSALIQGYESVRPLEAAERAALTLLAQGACLRFVASRTEDWFETPTDAHVTRKDPMDFARRWDFYAKQGHRVFA
ncbi:homoserine kinase [Erythrobacter sp. SDW2]|uniref:homoserine kinase n=1 Tax=Erythrobacter sp. SDW2 TaxID=2907154 RepID=UPI001F34C8FA|nr:homoserine kinase [Erythrobacter sp. SDW2]UIP06532.1 homoserine kinase [Erythrobacter sp. SDW2]